MFGHKISLNKFKKPEILSSIFSEYNGMKLEINYKKEARKVTDMWRLNNMVLNNYCVNGEIKGKNLKYLKTNKNESITYQNLWVVAKVVLRGKFIVIQAYVKKQKKSQTI